MGLARSPRWLTCWLAGKDRLSSSRKAVRFTGLDITNSKRAALPEARKIVWQACHILTEPAADALTAA